MSDKLKIKKQIMMNFLGDDGDSQQSLTLLINTIYIMTESLLLWSCRQLGVHPIFPKVENYTSCVYNFTNRTFNITKLLVDKTGISYYNAVVLVN